MKNKELYGAVFVFGAMLSITGPVAAKETHKNAKIVAATTQSTEGLCYVKAIYELKVSEDDKSLVVYNEAGVLVSRLTEAQLAGFNAKARHFMVSEDCMSVEDKALLKLIEENPVNRKQAQKPEVKEDPYAKFLVYTGSSGKVAGLKFYEFDQEERTHQKAIEFCEAKGLRLMTLDEAKDLQKELKADQTKLASWLGEKKSNLFWTSTIVSLNRNLANNFYADVNGTVAKANGTIANVDGERAEDYGVRCVPQ